MQPNVSRFLVVTSALAIASFVYGLSMPLMSLVLTKQGVSLWSTEAGPPFAFHDVTKETDAATLRAEVDGSAEGEARVVSGTVECGAEGPERAIAIVELADGGRGLVSSPDRELARAFTASEFGGRSVQLSGDGGFRL